MPTRRTILAAAGASALSAKSYAQVRGANDRIHVAVMGINSRGVAHINGFAAQPNTRVSHLIDVDTEVLEKRGGEFAKRSGSTPTLVRDYRRALENRDIDALAIATPDHWHAKASMDGMAAGKHVYVEKPLGMTPSEGEALIAGQKRYGRVLQMGNQQRSSVETRELVALVREGLLGEIYAADTWYANNRKSIGNGTPAAPPAHLDWELWQGPRPRRPYRSNLVHYNWHWFWYWGTGEICNNALHEVDIARWLMGVDYPERVRAKGERRFHRGDDWEMYDTMALTLAYSGGREIRWDGHSCNNVQRYGRGRGVLVYGTKGSALVDRNGYEVFDLAGKSVRKASAKAASGTIDTMGEGALDILHMANFNDLIRGQAKHQASPVLDGHVSTTLCHLGNMAYRTGKELQIDARTGRPRAADAMKLWSLDYQPGWSLT